MEKAYNPKENEQKINKLWESSNAFSPDFDGVDNTKEPFSILLPPPNANASLHAGHAMYVIEDILVRWKRMQGHPTVWIPGTDHAGFETQFVYEKHLSKAGKSRFQFDRDSLYNDIATFVKENSGLIEEQLKKLGFSLDWSRKTYMLDKHVLEIVYSTFQKMAKDGLIYRDLYIVNYCPKFGTTFSDLETKHIQRNDPLYYMQYGPFVVATVRPETMFGDTAIAVHPDDKKNASWIGKTVEVQTAIGSMELKVIADPEIDPEFGTGIMKVTPAHDPHDFQLGRANNLPTLSVIDLRGKLDLSSWLARTNLTPEQRARAEKYHGKKSSEARKLVAEDLQQDGLLVKTDEKYLHNIVVSYKGEAEIEPLVIPNWFVRMKPLAAPAIEAVKKKTTTIIPARFEKLFFDWMNNIRDWPISRQIVWGIRIPVWYSTIENTQLEVTFLTKTKEQKRGIVPELLKEGYTLQEIRSGLQELRAPIQSSYVVSTENPGEEYLPETDTFDTWFSSGQWPLTTLHYPDGEDFKRFYPTSVLDTMWDILFFWVARMMMFGLYLTNEVPFKTVYLHSMVTDEKGQKMSKSKGNVINPIDIIDEFGADALRISLVAGSTPGNPISMSKEKVKGYRNFSNKLWNIGRFILMQKDEGAKQINTTITSQSEKEILEKKGALASQVTQALEKYRFSDAALLLYDFVWNDFANTYLESSKGNENTDEVFTTLIEVFTTCLKLLHPFMPFVTEAIWQELFQAKIVSQPLLTTAAWPKT